jgi:hypothetical protein
VLVVPFFVGLSLPFFGEKKGQIARSEIGGQRRRKSARKTAFFYLRKHPTP